MSATRKNGQAYAPQFIAALASANCIGCGRCYKVCGQEVLNLVDRGDLDMDDDMEDEGTMVMVIQNDGNCIGCQACGRVCPKKCHSFAAAA